jgi:hypothetical protein
MVDVLCCFSDGPIDGDPFPNGEAFQVSMKDTCCENPGCCIAGLLCPCCVSWKLRKDYLRGDMSKYVCCQNEIPSCCCFKPGSLGEESCPELCLCVESCCCTIQSVSSTRSATMRTYGLTSDPFDRKLIRCTNCLMCVSCLCTLCNCEGKDTVEKCVDAVVAVVMGCMLSQVDHELKYRRHATNNTPLSKGLLDPDIAYGVIVDERVDEGAPLIKNDMKR